MNMLFGLSMITDAAGANGLCSRYPSITKIPAAKNSRVKVFADTALQLCYDAGTIFKCCFTFKPTYCFVFAVKISFPLLKCRITHLPFLCSAAGC